MYMFVPLYIFVNIVFVLMSGMAYWILERKNNYIYQSISEKGVVRVITNDGSIVILCIGIMRWPTNLHLTTKHTF